MSPKLLNILLVLVPVVLYLGYLSPMYDGSQGILWTPESNINVLKAQNVQYKNALNQVSLIQTEIGKIDKDYKSLGNDLIASTTVLLSDGIDPVKLREEVSSIANKSGVAITGLAVIPYPGADPNLSFYLISFSTVSRYPVFKEMMQNYEKNMRLYMVDSVVINHPDKKAGDAQTSVITDNEALNIQVSLKVSYLK